MSKARNRIHKVMFVIGSLSGGGAERVVSSLSNAFTQQGIEVEIACIGRKAQQTVYHLNKRINVRVLDAKHGGILGKLGQLCALRKHAKAFRPDVVVAFMSYIAVQTIAALLCTDIPAVFCIRANITDELRSVTIRLLCRLLYPHVRGAVYQTQSQKEYFKPHKRRKDVILYNPIQPIQAWEKPREESTKVLTVGRLDALKRFDLLIKAFAYIADAFPEYTLEIVGEGVLRGELEALVESIGLSGRVLLPGFQSNIPERLRTSALFVISSDSEGMPNALIEAMCLGTPCITTDFDGGGAYSLVQDGVDGLIVPKNNVEALADAMKKLLNDPAFAARLGEQAKGLREKVKTDNVVYQWIVFLEEVINA